MSFIMAGTSAPNCCPSSSWTMPAPSRCLRKRRTLYYGLYSQPVAGSPFISRGIVDKFCQSTCGITFLKSVYPLQSAASLSKLRVLIPTYKAVQKVYFRMENMRETSGRRNLPMAEEDQVPDWAWELAEALASTIEFKAQASL